MAIPLVNSVASWFLKKRFHQIDLFLKYPHEVQNELLMSLISISKDTEIGGNLTLTQFVITAILLSAFLFQLTRTIKI